MHRHALIGVVLVSAVALGGCVINITDEDARWGDSVEAKELHNRDYIGDVELGTPIEVVRAELGEPDFSEAWLEQGREVRVLRYRTHRKHADGDTTADETTPLVFRDGKLAGIGERFATGG